MFSGMKSQERESLLSGVSRCCAGGTGGDVSRGGRARGRAETRRGGGGFRARAIASARAASGATRGHLGRVSRRGENQRRMRAARGRRASEDDGDPSGCLTARASRTRDRATHHLNPRGRRLLRGGEGGWGRLAADLADRDVTQTACAALRDDEDLPQPRPSARVGCRQGRRLLARQCWRGGCALVSVRRTGGAGAGFEAGIRFRSMGSKWRASKRQRRRLTFRLLPRAR